MDTNKISQFLSQTSPFKPGLTYMVLSAFFFCLMTVFVKLAGQTLPTVQIVFVRGLFTLVLTYILIYREQLYPFGNNKPLLIMRGVSGTAALFFVYESIKRFPLSEATVIQYLFPIFTAIIAALIISEPLNRKIALAIIIGLLGVYITLGAPFIGSDFNEINIQDIFIAITGSFLTGIAYVLVRQSTKLNEHPLVVMLYFPLFTVPACFPFLFSSWVSPKIEVWSFLILIGFCTQLGQFFLTHGYKELPAGQAAPLSYIQVPFAMIMGMSIFGEKFSIYFLIGSILVFLSIKLVTESGNNS